jgi:hypothetical protein
MVRTIQRYRTLGSFASRVAPWIVKPMHPSIKFALLGIAVAGAIIFAGCASRSANGTDAAAFGAVVMTPLMEPPMVLAYGANEFRVANHRWPGNYNELTNFLNQAGDKCYSSFQSVKYRHIEFVEMPDGKLRIETDYTFSSAVTNSNGTVDSSGTVTVKGMKMVVPPTDPRNMVPPTESTSNVH